MNRRKLLKRTHGARSRKYQILIWIVVHVRYEYIQFTRTKTAESSAAAGAPVTAVLTTQQFQHPPPLPHSDRPAAYNTKPHDLSQPGSIKHSSLGPIYPIAGRGCMAHGERRVGRTRTAFAVSCSQPSAFSPHCASSSGSISPPICTKTTRGGPWRHTDTASK